LVFGNADEIFTLGRELMNAVKHRPGARTLRFYVGVVDSFPKLVTTDILAPVFGMPQTVHVICREGKLEDLLAQLAVRDASALLHAENTALRRALEKWFRDLHLEPRVVAEFEDLALMKVMAAA
jgi:LysR family transcriptional activator of nhaA